MAEHRANRTTGAAFEAMKEPRIPPSPALIDAMDETLSWMKWLSPPALKIIQWRAAHRTWPEIAAALHCSDTGAQNRLRDGCLAVYAHLLKSEQHAQVLADIYRAAA